MSGKVLVSAVSLILVCGVAIGTVMVVHKQSDDPNNKISTHENAVSQMCSNADDKEFCQETFSKVNDTSDPKAYLSTAVEATINSVIKALNMSDRLIVEHKQSHEGLKMALDDCKDLLESAMDSLEASINLLRNGTMEAVNEKSPDFKNWLSAVISYQSTCMDTFDENNDGEKQVKSQLQEQGLDDMGKFTGIALDIMADLANVLSKFGLALQVKPAARRLMEVDSEGFPTWFSASDRKLLGGHHGKKGGHHGKNGGGIHQGPGVTPNVVVAQDGSGQFKTVTDAINSYPPNGVGPQGRYIIFIKAGIYKEYIIVPKTAVNLFLIGEGAGRTIITGNKNFVDGVKTMNTATFANTAPGFVAKGLTFENSAGAIKHQAVAFRNQGDMSAIFDCAIVGYQDTLYAQTNRQFYRNCDISGTIDFIFGSSATLIQSSRIVVRRPLDNQFNTVTADGKDQKSMVTGIVIQNCDIIPEPALFPDRFTIKSYLGRPWKQYSTTVVMESRIGDVIQPAGWTPWEGNLFLNTLFYAEYNNAGPGANMAGRVKWPGYKGLISRDQAARFTVGQFLSGGIRAEDWLRFLQVPFDIGFTH